MLSILEGWVVNLEEFIGDVRETLEVSEGRTVKLDSMEEQFREYMLESISSNVDAIWGVVNSTIDKLLMRDDVLEAMVMDLKEETKAITKALSTIIEELEGELVVCWVVVSKRVLGATLNREIDFLKSKKFKGERSAR